MRMASERFWEKVSMASERECWEWQASVDKNGYGRFRPGTTKCSPKIRAHRYAWFEAFGEVPVGVFVLHRCDNPKCVNPAHLFLGTAADNARDRDRKGRGNRSRDEIGRWARVGV